MPITNARVWPLAVLVLALLFAQLGPESTQHLPLLVAWVVWSAHIGLGLGFAILATSVVGRWVAPSLPTWPLLALGGVLGSLVFAPFALGFDLLFPTPEGPPDDVLDHWEAQGGLLALAAEWLNLAPLYLASWLLLNIAPLAPRASGVPVSAGQVALPPPPTAMTSVNTAAEPTAPVDAPHSADLETTVAVPTFLSRLPAAVGRDVIRVESDLHYLQVHTTRGRATLLGSLADVEAALPELGLRVHRSHWVAIAHLRRVSKSAKGWACETQAGERIPVSRRRWAEVRARLGRDFIIDADD